MNSAFSLRGKRVLVTGASSGLGRSIAIECSLMGATVIGVGRDELRLEQTLNLMENGSTNHQMVTADLTTDKGRNSVLNTLIEPVDGCVHCAGISRLSPVRMMTENHLQELSSININAPFLLTQGLLSKQKINSGGSILFISSIATHIGVAGVAGYSGTKAAVVAMSRCLAMEVIKRRIRVNCLSPALVETPLLDATAKIVGSMEDEKKNYPLGFGNPEDIAYACVFYLSDASRWITGTDLIMDGGLTIS